MRMGRPRAAREVYGPPGRVLRVKKLQPGPTRGRTKMASGRPENPMGGAESWPPSNLG